MRQRHLSRITHNQIHTQRTNGKDATHRNDLRIIQVGDHVRKGQGNHQNCEVKPILF